MIKQVVLQVYRSEEEYVRRMRNREKMKKMLMNWDWAKAGSSCWKMIKPGGVYKGGVYSIIFLYLFSNTTRRHKNNCMV